MQRSSWIVDGECCAKDEAKSWRFKGVYCSRGRRRQLKTARTARREVSNRSSLETGVAWTGVPPIMRRYRTFRPTLVEGGGGGRDGGGGVTSGEPEQRWSLVASVEICMSICVRLDKRNVFRKPQPPPTAPSPNDPDPSAKPT